jgi:pyruvate dehydrogenase E1 component alpha subunit
MIERWKEKDPVALYERRLLEEGVMTTVDLEAVAARIHREIEAAVAEAESAPPPDPAGAAEGVFAP